jgi:YD repeat-containing protein
VVDPGGLGLTTAYETDPRGNVTATTDPRGVRHRTRYNVFDWPIESTAAESGASDGAPPLYLTTTVVYDEAGQVVEERIPFGDGSDVTKVQREYGVLGELRAVRREVTPGGEDWITESRDYDENFNLHLVTDPRGHVTRFEYDERNVPTTVVRCVPQ